MIPVLLKTLTPVSSDPSTPLHLLSNPLVKLINDSGGILVLSYNEEGSPIFSPSPTSNKILRTNQFILPLYLRRNPLTCRSQPGIHRP